MYHGWSQTWRGLMKNATEGIANGRLIVPATSLIVMGYLAPTALAIHQLMWPSSTEAISLAVAAACISYIPRIVSAARFDQSWLSVSLFPLSILLFVALQWVAFCRLLLGSELTWRGRAYPATMT
jgi:hypothetical protein